MNKASVILVDEEDRALGTSEKMMAHRQGWLHRAFSVFVYDVRGRMLIHRRAADKYHAGGLWSNACCSHPMPDESLPDAVNRRLEFEMGLNLETSKIFETKYRLHLDNGMIEHEYDHVYIGTCASDPIPNPEEVAEWAYMATDELLRDVRRNPQRYTPWFRLLLPRVLETGAPQAVRGIGTVS